MTKLSLTTPRLVLRQWREEDREAFARLTADTEVMAHFPSTLDRAASEAMVDRIDTHFARFGFGFWAVEVPGVAPFIGFVGLVHLTYEAHFTPAVEIGWRLSRAYWGKGYAGEAAQRAIQDGFGRLALDEIVALTVPANLRSRRVMERLGMTRIEADDFDHPNVPAGHPLRPHVLYRLRRSDWAGRH